MKTLHVTLGLICLCIHGYSQKLSQITIDNRSASTTISYLVDETVTLNIDKDGSIIDWGTEYTTLRTGIYPGKLLKYMGREEYYPATDKAAYQGKIKYIGRTLITYYSDENEAFKGKVKSIGANQFDYYAAYENAAYKGNIKSAGSVTFTYYGAFDDESYRGKLKNVGSVGITYFGRADDKAFRGKVKNVDHTSFTYYSSFDRPGYSGALKTGSPVVYSGGVKYYLKN